MKKILPPAEESGSLGDEAMLVVAHTHIPEGEIAAIGADTADGSYGARRWWNESHIDRVVNFSWSALARDEAVCVFRRLREAGTKFISRDEYSRQRCQTATGISCECGADIAFLAPIRTPQIECRSPFIVVVVRKEMNIGAMIGVLRKIPAKTVVVSHDRRKGVGDDRAAVSLAQRLGSEAILPMGYVEACDLYQQAEMVFSYRMHGCILAMRCGCPAVMLREYRDKARGQFSYFDLEDLVFTEEHLGIEAIPELWERRHEIREQVRRKLAWVQQTAHRHFT